jgi:peptide deformylase
VTGHPKATTSHGLVVVFDPMVVDASNPEVLREGCLSVPDLTADVRRTRRLVIRGLTDEGETRELAMEGFEARAALHELDHLDGLLILDRVDSPSSLFPRRVYR